MSSVDFVPENSRPDDDFVVQAQSGGVSSEPTSQDINLNLGWDVG